MTFELKTKLNPVVSGPSVHKLDRDALWKWWQMSQAFALIPKRTTDSFTNHTLRMSMLFLLTCPVHLAFMLYMTVPSALAEHKEFAVVKLAAMTVLVWLSQLWLFILAGRRHIRIAQQIVATEDGLEISAPFFKKKVLWSEINDVFPVGNFESGYDLHEVDCNNGEWFLLSEKLSESNRLLALIESKLSRKLRPSFSLNYRIPDGVMDSVPMALWAVLIAISFSLAAATKVPTLSQLAIFAVVIAGAAAVRWLFVNKVAQLVRIGESEIYLRTRSQSQLIAMDGVKEIKKLGNFLVVKTRSNWFALFLSKKEPVNEKLLECRSSLILQQQKVIT